MLRSDIRKFVNRSSCKTLDDMVVRSREREIDLDLEKTTKSDQVQSSDGLGKRTKVFDL